MFQISDTYLNFFISTVYDYEINICWARCGTNIIQRNTCHIVTYVEPLSVRFCFTKKPYKISE